VFAYHDRTKHDFTRSARGPGYLDWTNQPDPFRRFDGAPTYLLPLDDDDPTPTYESLYAGAVPPQPLGVSAVGRFLEYSLAVSATKSAGGSSWKLRCNPSSGNLHPTEGYLVLPAIEDLCTVPGVYHYRADEHALEQRCAFSVDTWTRLAYGFPAATFFAALTSIHWREAWKYGERAFRYCNHDVGHALGALRYAAAALGWQCAILDALGDDAIAAVLGLDRNEDFGGAEPEHPDALLAIVTNPHGVELPDTLPDEAVAGTAHASWRGAANRLSEEHVEWPIIEDTARATRKPSTPSAAQALSRSQLRPREGARAPGFTAARIFRQRRSAVDMDGVTGISREDFYLVLERSMPRPGRPPFDTWPHAPAIHLGLFVHRVEDLAPGLYFLVRNDHDAGPLKAAMRREFTWSTPQGCPADLPLYHLASGDCRSLAAQVSCTQDIAGAGAFSLGMIARFESPLRERGPWFYPRFFWEAGLIGQTLYLEAEAAGLRGTGIGCYFDDPVHRVFGLTGHAFQSLYHFTVGGPVDDPRLSGLPPYDTGRRAQRGWV
jgi:SagB-type dehydrogenase family enzyme